MTDIDVSKCTITTSTTTKTMSTSQEQKLKRKEKMQEQTKATTTATAVTAHDVKAKTTNTKATNTNNNQTNSGNKNGNGNEFSNMHFILGGDKPDAYGFIGSIGSGFKKRIEHVARMPTARNATEYNLNHKNRGRAIIFNHENFDIPNLSERLGTAKDCKDLTDALSDLGFDVSVHNDSKIKEIMQCLEEVSSQDHSDNDCICIVILSHGEHGYLYARDVQYKLDNLAHYFTALSCPTLAGKPKIFFIQACRGDNFDSGILLQRKTETDGESSTSYKIPVHADFLFAYSTMPGFYSWRSPSDGSWFIQALVQELKANGRTHDILTLLTFVNQRVAFDKESFVPDEYIKHGQKQIPCITSMLTRILRFNDKNKIEN